MSTPCLLTEAQEVICIINYYFRPQIFEFLYNFVGCKFVMSNKICKTIAKSECHISVFFSLYRAC